MDYQLVRISALDDIRILEAREIADRFLLHLKEREWVFKEVANNMIQDIQNMYSFEVHQIAQCVALSLDLLYKYNDKAMLEEDLKIDKYYVSFLSQLFLDQPSNSLLEKQVMHIVEEALTLTLKEVICWSASGVESSFNEVSYEMF